MRTEEITPAIMCCNEEYWIYYCLRDLVKIFGTAVVLDTGSVDNTVPIIKEYFPQVHLLEHAYHGNPTMVGNGRNVLREIVETPWMFLVDADEIWIENKLRRILEFEINPGVEVVMVAGWNVEDCEGKLQLRTNDLANRDGLFSRDIKWTALHYPFEGYGLEEYIEKGKGQYLPANEIYAWHMRHTLRSSKNWETFFRKDKINFYPYSGPFEDLPDNWIGEVNPKIINPYLSVI